MQQKISTLLLFCYLLFSQNTFAQVYGYDWAKTAGGTGQDEGLSIAADKDNNIITVGYFNDTIDLDPGTGTMKMHSNGSNDIFVQKLSAAGSYIWGFTIGSTGSDKAQSVITDANGNIYVTGNYAGTVDFDPGSGITSLTSSGSEDIYFAKYKSDGSLAWVKSVGGSAGDNAYSIARDDAGLIFLTGYFRTTADFDPDPVNTANITATGGAPDIFVAAYDSTGGYLSANSGGDVSGDAGNHIVTYAGALYVTGDFQGTADFDPIGTYNLTSAGASDIFIAKYDVSTSAMQWAKNMGGTVNDGGYGIAVDDKGSVYTTGYFQGTAVDFDPGTGTTSLTAAAEDIFIQKLDANGDFRWVKQIGGVNPDMARNIKMTSTGNGILVTGSFTSVVDFDPGSGTANLTGSGQEDAFILMLDTAGIFQWAKSMGGSSTDIGYHITAAADLNIYTTGRFAGTADFHTEGTDNLTSAGLYDAFIHKLKIATGNVAGNAIAAGDITLFPNPATNKLHIALKQYHKQITITITDINGKVLQQQQHTGNTATADITALAAGNYYISIHTGNASTIAPFTKL